MAFTPSAIKSLTGYLPNVTGGIVDVAMNPAVNPANTMLVLSGWRRNSASGFPDGNGSGYCTLLNGSTIRCVCSLPGGYPAIIAVEFYGGFLRQPVQYGTVSIAGVGAANVGIAAVGSKPLCNFLGFNQNSNSIQTDMATQTPIAYLINSSTVQAARLGTGGVNSPDTIATVSFCVVDFK